MIDNNQHVPVFAFNQNSPRQSKTTVPTFSNYLEQQAEHWQNHRKDSSENENDQSQEYEPKNFDFYFSP